jgi:hypothetical protein
MILSPLNPQYLTKKQSVFEKSYFMTHNTIIVQKYILKTKNP